MRAVRRGLIGLALGAALLGAGPGSALASSITTSSGVVSYNGAASEANRVVFWFEATYGVYVIQDTGVTSIDVGRSGKGCHSYTAQIAYCDYTAVASVIARLGNRGGVAESKLATTPVTIYAGAGDDTLIGGGGTDTLFAAGGTDTLVAGAGRTRLVGGTGTTTMTGGPGQNTYEGGPGIDTINARNGVAETVTCAAGADSVTADPADATAADCEAVDRGGAPAPPATGGSTEVAPGIDPGLPVFEPPAPSVSTEPVALTATNDVPVRIGCPELVAGGCEGEITIALAESRGRKKDRVVAARRVRRNAVSRTRRFRIAAGEELVVPVTLSRRGGRTVRRSLRRKGSVQLAVTVAMRTEAGTQRTTRTITVRAARRSGRGRASRKRRH